jgi:hypothetical protein
MELPDTRPGACGAGQFILLHDSDNILVCARTAAAGSPVEIDGQVFVLPQDVELGHKIARRALAAGDKVLRYGVAIGSMTQPVSPAQHVHSHNLKSDYIAAHSRDAVRTGILS